MKRFRSFLTSTLLILSAALTVAASEPETAAGPLPPSIMPVVILQGSDYELGYQYGQQAGPYLVARKEAAWASALTHRSRDEVLESLKAYLWYIKQYAPEIVDEIKGMAAGAREAGHDLNYTDVLLLNAGQAVPAPSWNFPDGAADQQVTMGCSSWAAWGDSTKDGTLICGDSQDRPFFHSLVLVVHPENGHSYVGPAIAGYFAHKPAMNSKGVSVGATGGMGQRDIDHDYGIPFHCAIQHMMRFADTAREAKDMLLSWDVAENCSWVIADVSGDAYIVEMTSAIKSVRRAGDFGETHFIYATNNYLNPEMKDVAKGLQFVPHAGWGSPTGSRSSISRNKELWTMFTSYHGQVDLDFAKMMWRFTEGSGVPLGSASSGENEKDLEQSWNFRICNLVNASVCIVQPKDGFGGRVHVCTGPASKDAPPAAPNGAAQWQISGTHTFYELTLEESPAELVKQAWIAAHERIADVNSALRTLTSSDPRFGTLQDLFSVSKAEYFEGISWNNKARLAEGNEALALYAKAATAFTRSQAHAKQVSHHLSPPASRPDDLGLTPYGETAWSTARSSGPAREQQLSRTAPE